MIFFITLLTFSCSIFSRYKYKTFKSSQVINDKEQEILYNIKIPKGYSDYYVIENHAKEYRYLYKDSVVLYIRLGEPDWSSVNYDSIKTIPKASMIKFQVNKGLKDDTLLFHGKIEEEFYWKEKIIGNFEIGYKKVPSDKKEIFDHSIHSLNKK